MSRQSSRGAAWEALRRQVLERDQYVCQYCGAEATEADHVIPKDAGGRDELDNLVASCKPCNARKGNRIGGRITWFNRRWLAGVG
ncbi:HNH endonuclease [Agromyces archimandritae]|uniref:HNH endonuclease n=1 Tax=Agromyces archimandritae TaxID=2781962 RepID=A0A975FL63_9MICO|nr:HNH endonuclease [Agromyces archimandritae]QTX04120.1 HNH endonuclease [Agromyces archimandritae]